MCIDWAQGVAQAEKLVARATGPVPPERTGEQEAGQREAALVQRQDRGAR
jgi:hypothetical protein